MNETDRYRALKAFDNEGFIHSRDGRSLRILSEYLEPASRFEHFKVSDTIVFMGSARIPSGEDAQRALKDAQTNGADARTLTRAEKNLKLSRYYEDSRELAGRLTTWSKSLDEDSRRFVICTGGGPGIMEAANRGASEAKGLNMGFNISLPMEQSDNPYVTHQLNFEFHYFFMRKFWFAYLAKAIVVMPGGFGTLEELFEIITLLQTKKIEKRLPVVVYGTQYWNEIMNLQALADWGTISQDDLDLMFFTDSVDEAFDYLTKELTEYSVDKPGANL